MQKVVDVKVDLSHRSIKCGIIACIDSRFTESLNKFIKEYLGLTPEEIDIFRWAGGAKGLASPGNEHERPFALNQLLISAKEHHVRKFYLVVHSDCAGYGFPSFPSEDEEKRFFSSELKKAKLVAQEFLENVEIEGRKIEAEIITVFFSADGIWREIA